MVGDRVIIGFFMPFFVAERKQYGGKQNAKLQAIKTALTGKVNVSKTTFSREAKVKQKNNFISKYSPLYFASEV